MLYLCGQTPYINLYLHVLQLNVVHTWKIRMFDFVLRYALGFYHSLSIAIHTDVCLYFIVYNGSNISCQGMIISEHKPKYIYMDRCSCQAFLDPTWRRKEEEFGGFCSSVQKPPCLYM